MQKLFLIGNGFDLSHGIASSYTDFRVFLTEKTEENVSYMPFTYTDQDGDTVADESTSASLLIQLIDEISGGSNWCDLELYLSKFNYNQFFEEYDLSEAINDEDDDEMFRVAQMRTDVAIDLKCCVEMIKSFFREWISRINIEVAAQKRYSKLFDKDSLFLTFNYTRTLEDVYKTKDSAICHIHGTMFTDIYFGHGEEHNPYFADAFETIGIDVALSELFEGLRKNVSECYRKHNSFFKTIADAEITDIYSIGFSFSAVDSFYVKAICSLLNTKHIVWHLTQYDEDRNKNKKYMKLLRKWGFKGCFRELIPDE